MEKMSEPAMVEKVEAENKNWIKARQHLDALFLKNNVKPRFGSSSFKNGNKIYFMNEKDEFIHNLITDYPWVEFEMTCPDVYYPVRYEETIVDIEMLGKVEN